MYICEYMLLVSGHLWTSLEGREFLSLDTLPMATVK